jgi:hypothetical protein
MEFCECRVRCKHGQILLDAHEYADYALAPHLRLRHARGALILRLVEAPGNDPGFQVSVVGYFGVAVPAFWQSCVFHLSTYPSANLWWDMRIRVSGAYSDPRRSMMLSSRGIAPAHKNSATDAALWIRSPQRVRLPSPSQPDNQLQEHRTRSRQHTPASITLDYALTEPNFRVADRPDTIRKHSANCA